MRSKKALKNIIYSIIYSGVSVLYGLIVPKLLIENFGSEMNGFITSVIQIFGYLVLIHAGVGGVVKAKLYKPISQNDFNQVNNILSATKKFFNKIGYISILSTIILSLIYPVLINTNLQNDFIGLMIFFISLHFTFQYFLGISYQLWLTASGKDYVNNFSQTIALITTIIAIYLMTTFNTSILIIQIVMSLILVTRVIYINLYTKMKYHLRIKNKASLNKLKDRWDGVAHTIAYFVHTRIDIILISIFLTLQEVSVYAIYAMVISGVKIIITTVVRAFEPFLGNMISKKENNILIKSFLSFNTIIHILITILFSSTLILIIPFLKIYTMNFSDYNYINSVLALTLISAELIYMLRKPLVSIISAAGHYKETKVAAFIEMGINVFLSIMLINIYGVIGLVLSTLIAMLFRLVYSIIYVSKNLIKIKLSFFIKRFLITLIMIYGFLLLFDLIDIQININYYDWIIKSFVVVIVITIITSVINYLFYNSHIRYIMKRIKKTMTLRRKQ